MTEPYRKYKWNATHTSPVLSLGEVTSSVTIFQMARAAGGIEPFRLLLSVTRWMFLTPDGRETDKRGQEEKFPVLH